MSKIVHAYPFPLDGWHGGTMRLASAIRGSAMIPNSVVEAYVWDGDKERWDGPIEPSQISQRRAAASSHPSATRSATGRLVRRLKRWFFPATLWESGRAAADNIDQIVARGQLTSSDTIVLHTTYLAPAVPACKATGAVVVADVHDLVWRAHRLDAVGAPFIPWLARTVYAASVRRREEGLCAQADGLLVAGWRDAQLLDRLARLVWSPTGIPSPEAAVVSRTGRLRVGLIGNFNHSATIESARDLAQGPLGDDQDIELVFAGLGSNEHPEFRVGVRALGRIDAVSEFYDEIDAVVVPVTNASGMKCKLAEGALAGKLVVTTPAGASGYPDQLRKYFAVDESPGRLGAALLARLATSYQTDRTVAMSAFAKSVGTEAAAERVAAALRGTWGLSSAQPRQGSEF